MTSLDLISRIQLRAASLSHHDLDTFTHLKFVAYRIVHPYTEGMTSATRIRVLRRWLNDERVWGITDDIDFMAVATRLSVLLPRLRLTLSIVYDLLMEYAQVEEDKSPFAKVSGVTAAAYDWMFIDDAMQRYEMRIAERSTTRRTY